MDMTMEGVFHKNGRMVSKINRAAAKPRGMRRLGKAPGNLIKEKVENIYLPRAPAHGGKTMKCIIMTGRAPGIYFSNPRIPRALRDYFFSAPPRRRMG
jgi:hypothetical protein